MPNLEASSHVSLPPTQGSRLRCDLQMLNTIIIIIASFLIEILFKYWSHDFLFSNKWTRVPLDLCLVGPTSCALDLHIPMPSDKTKIFLTQEVDYLGFGCVVLVHIN